jgi:hypothetical protein
MTASSPSLVFPIKLAGLVTGLVLAASLVFFLRIPQADGRLGADVRLVATPPTGLTTTSSGAFLTGRHLTSGGEAATGKLPLTNDSRTETVVSFRVLARHDRLSHHMTIELSVAGHKVAGGSLAELGRWNGALRIPRGSTRTVEASAWIPGSARAGYEGHMADVNLQIRAKAARP